MHNLALTQLIAYSVIGVSALIQLTLAQVPEFGSAAQLGALGILAIVIVWIVTRTLPERDKQFAEQAKTAQQAALETVKATAATTAEVAKIHNETISTLHREYIASLDKIADRFHSDTLTTNEVMRQMHTTCPAGLQWRSTHGPKE